MKKYRLLVDLPTFKKGEIFKLREKGLYKVKSKNEDKEILAYLTKTINDFRILEKEKGFFEEIKEKSIWNLEHKDEYFGINREGDISDCLVNSYNIMNKQREIGNVFLTREEAEKELKKRQAIQRIKKYCWENGINNNFEVGKYNIVLETIKGEFLLNYCELRSESFIGFFDFDDAEKILENCESDLKIIFDV